MSRLRWNQVSWPNSLFLVGTLLLTLTAVPLYVWRQGLDWFQVVLFFAFFIATGLSITMGYHRQSPLACPSPHVNFRRRRL